MLADERLGATLTGLAAGRTVDVCHSPSQFARQLTAVRPQVALLARPPAEPFVLEFAARERRRRETLRIALLSPADDVGGRLTALEHGFDDAYSETIAPIELAGRLVLLADRARSRQPPTSLPIRSGMRIDLLANELRLDDVVVHLRPKEYQLLAILAAHPRRAFTRRQLLDRVWGRNHLGDPRTVDVHVRWLRSKIEADPDRPVHLVTVRGVGYRLDPAEPSEL